MQGVISRVREKVLESAETGEWVYEELFFGNQAYPDGADYRFRGTELQTVYSHYVSLGFTEADQEARIAEWMGDPQNVLMWEAKIGDNDNVRRLHAFVDWTSPEGWNAYLSDRSLGTWGWDTWDVSYKPLDSEGYPAGNSITEIIPLKREDHSDE